MKKNKDTREKWLQEKLNQIPKKHKILDAGAGETQYKKFCKHLDYTSQDFGKYTGKENKEGKQKQDWDNSKLDIISDIINIPIKNNSFDAIMCIEVLEHLPYPIKAIKEFSRILKKGGKLIITAPFASLTHFAPYHYSSGFNKYWYEKILNENKFKINEISKNGNYFDFLAQEIGRLPAVEKKYTKSNLSQKITYRIINKIMRNLLQKLSNNNINSEELLCFGIQVEATKI